MNPFLLSPEERLSEWRKLRLSLPSFDEMDQLKRVAKWVSQAPTINFVLDYDHPETWITPWELLAAGDFDDTAKAYLMLKTLQLSGWDNSRMKLIYVRNIKESMQSMIVLIDDKWALNYYHNEVINFDKEQPDCAYLVEYKIDEQGNISDVN